MHQTDSFTRPASILSLYRQQGPGSPGSGIRGQSGSRTGQEVQVLHLTHAETHNKRASISCSHSGLTAQAHSSPASRPVPLPNYRQSVAGHSSLLTPYAAALSQQNNYWTRDKISTDYSHFTRHLQSLSGHESVRSRCEWKFYCFSHDTLLSLHCSCSHAQRFITGTSFLLLVHTLTPENLTGNPGDRCA